MAYTLQQRYELHSGLPEWVLRGEVGMCWPKAQPNAAEGIIAMGNYRKEKKAIQTRLTADFSQLCCWSIGIESIYPMNATSLDLIRAQLVAAAGGASDRVPCAWLTLPQIA